MKLDGTVAVVLGGTNEIGKSYCESLLASGVKVMFCGPEATTGFQIKEEMSYKFSDKNVDFVKCGHHEGDIRGAITFARERWGRLDIIVNNMGSLHESTWQRMMQVNMGSALATSALAEELMGINHGGEGGILVHTGSRSGVYPSPFMPVCSATKAAVVQYVRAMMHPSNYQHHGIRMMCICPGLTKTDFFSGNFNLERVQLFAEINKGVRYKNETDAWIQPEWVGELLITLLENDVEFKSVAAELNSRNPVFHYNGEWEHLRRLPGNSPIQNNWIL